MRSGQDAGCHFFGREAAFSHCITWWNYYIRILKTRVLVDTEACVVLNLYYSAHWPHDIYVGRQVALRSTGEIETLAGNKGYTHQSLRDAIRSEGVEPVIRRRLFAYCDHAHNVRLDSNLSGQRLMTNGIFFSARLSPVDSITKDAICAHGIQQGCLAQRS